MRGQSEVAGGEGCCLLVAPQELERQKTGGWWVGETLEWRHWLPAGQVGSKGAMPAEGDKM